MLSFSIPWAISLVCANLPAVTGVERQSPQRDHPRGVHGVDDRGPVRIEPTVQHRGGVLELAQLQKHMSARDLGDVQEQGEPTLERLGDYSIDRLERVFVAIEGEERLWSPYPGQELIESVLFSEPVAENRLEQLEGACDVCRRRIEDRPRSARAGTAQLGQGARRRLLPPITPPRPPPSAPPRTRL